MRSYSVDKPIIIKAHALKYFTNLASHQPLQNRTVHRKSPSLLPPLSKVRCCRPIKFGRRPEGLQHLPRPFRFSDTSVNNPSIVGSASHCNRSSPLHKGAKGDTALSTFPKPHYPSKIAINLALLAPPVAPTLSIPTTIEKEQHALASHHHTCLPCQREVDWRQGTNLNIIAFTCDTLTIFILQTFLPSRRRDCHTTNLASHQPLLLHRILPFPHNHCKRTTIPRSTLSLQTKRPHLITGAVLLILNLTASQDYRQAG